MRGSVLRVLRHQLELAFGRRSWHGTNLLGSLRSVTLEQAAWRPQPSRHNVWELMVHAAYWKYRVYRLLTAEPPRSFDLRGSDFFPRPETATPEAWEADLGLLREWHARLLHAVERFDPARLEQPAGGSGHTHLELITGAGAHDLYHAGQIQLLKRLYPADLAPGRAEAVIPA